MPNLISFKGSDELSKSQRDSHRNEQDALKNLLESLENKRITKERENDQAIMKHGSVHQRIADARKMFTEGTIMGAEGN